MNKEELREYFLEEISPIFEMKWIQIVMLREVHDYLILRTEEDRELNTVQVPSALNNPKPEIHIAFLGSKQKAVENRAFMALLRNVDPDLKKCIIPGELCLECPRCVLFGAVNTAISQYNIKHRINYGTAYSLQSYETLDETIQFNAVNETDQLTGQALNVTHNVKPFGIFPSIVSLNSVTWEEFVLVMKTLISTKSYGAETRIKGVVRNNITGLAFGYEEIITPLEYMLELREKLNNTKEYSGNVYGDYTLKILNEYKKKAALKNKVTIVAGDELNNLKETISNIDLNTLVEALKESAKEFVQNVKGT